MQPWTRSGLFLSRTYDAIADCRSHRRRAEDIQHYLISDESRLSAPHFSSTDLASADGSF